MSKLKERIKKREDRKKKFLVFRVLMTFFMVIIAVVCVFFIDFHMSHMIDKKPLIEYIYFDF